MTQTDQESAVTDDQFHTYIFEYYFQGQLFQFGLDARTPEEAEVRKRLLPHAKLVGQHQFSAPIWAAPFVYLWVALANAWHRLAGWRQSR